MTSPDATSGDFIHRFVPAAGGADAPTLLLLHGTGGNENDLLNLGASLLPDAALLSPRGKVLENGMPRFFRRLAEGVFDLQDLQRRTHELADFVDAAAATYGFARDKVIVVGYSNGANIAASMLLLRPDVLAGAVLLRAMVPLEPAEAPKLNGVPVFLAAGRFDPIVPSANTERLAQLLESAGAEVTLHWQAAGHNLTQNELQTVQTWLGSQLEAHRGLAGG
jgi:predicted esterase